MINDEPLKYGDSTACVVAIDPTISEVKERLARIETKLDSSLDVMNKREKACECIAQDIITLKIEQGKQGIIIYLFTGIIATILSSIVSILFAYFSRK